MMPTWQIVLLVLVIAGITGCAAYFCGIANGWTTRGRMEVELQRKRDAEREAEERARPRSWIESCELLDRRAVLMDPYVHAFVSLVEQGADPHQAAIAAIRVLLPALSEMRYPDPARGIGFTLDEMYGQAIEAIEASVLDHRRHRV